MSSRSSTEDKKSKKHARDDEEISQTKKARTDGTSSKSSSTSSSPASASSAVSSPSSSSSSSSSSHSSSPLAKLTEKKPDEGKKEKEKEKEKEKKEKEKKEKKSSEKKEKMEKKENKSQKKDKKASDKKEKKEKEKEKKEKKPDKAKPDKEEKKPKISTKKASEKNKSDDFVLVIPSVASHPLHHLWEIPYIAHFTWLFQKALNIDAILPAQLEQAMAHPETDPIFAELLTRLIIDNLTDRNWLRKGEGFPFDILNDIVCQRFEAWFTEDEEGKPVYNDEAEEDEDMTTPDAFSARDFFNHINPLANGDLCTVDSVMRTHIFVALCEYRLKTNEEFYKQLRGLDPSDARVLPICNQMDSAGNQYFFFGYHDFRIYRQRPIFAKDVDKSTTTPATTSTPASTLAAQVSTSSSTSTSTSTSSSSTSARVSSQAASVRATPITIEFDLAANDQTSFQQLVKVLKNSPHKRDREISSALSDILDELTEEHKRTQEAKAKAEEKEERRKLAYENKRGSARLADLEAERAAEQEEEEQKNARAASARALAVINKAQSFKRHTLKARRTAAVVAKEAIKGDGEQKESGRRSTRSRG